MIIVREKKLFSLLFGESKAELMLPQDFLNVTLCRCHSPGKLCL